METALLRFQRLEMVIGDLKAELVELKASHANLEAEWSKEIADLEFERDMAYRQMGRLRCGVRAAVAEWKKDGKLSGFTLGYFHTVLQ